MSLHDFYKERVKQWLQQHNIQLRCPMCQGTAFEVGGLIGRPPDGLPDALNVESHVKPAPEIQLGCKNCWYVLHFAAQPLGLLEKSVWDFWQEQ